MRYLMLVTTNKDRPGEVGSSEGTMPTDGTMPIEDWVQETTRTGTREQGNVLAPATAATTVRRRNGKVLVTEGPFAEAAEQIAGFDILNCPGLTEAIRVAAAHPMAAGGSLELRPLLDD